MDEGAKEGGREEGSDLSRMMKVHSVGGGREGGREGRTRREGNEDELEKERNEGRDNTKIVEEKRSKKTRRRGR